MQSGNASLLMFRQSNLVAHAHLSLVLSGGNTLSMLAATPEEVDIVR